MNFAKCLRTPFFFYRIPLVTASVTGLRLFSCFHFFLFLPLEQPFPFSSLCVLPLVDLSSTSFIVLNTLLSFSSSMSWIAFTILWLWFSSVISSIVFTILFFSLLVVLWVSPASALITAAPLAMLWSGPSAFWDFSWCFLSVLPFLFGICDIFCLVPPVSITFVILIDFWYDLLHHFLHHHYRLLLFYSSNCESEACCGANFLVCGLFDFRLLGDPSWFVYGK